MAGLCCWVGRWLQPLAPVDGADNFFVEFAVVWHAVRMVVGGSMHLIWPNQPQVRTLARERHEDRQGP